MNEAEWAVSGSVVIAKILLCVFGVLWLLFVRARKNKPVGELESIVHLCISLGVCISAVRICIWMFDLF